MAQFGQGWVLAVAAHAPEGVEEPAPPAPAAFTPVAGVTGAELDRKGLPASGAGDWPIGAPHVSQ
jgi:hypothetical protein